MRITFIQVGQVGDEGEHYRWEAEVDVTNEDEAYVKGREFERLTRQLARGANAESAEYHAAERERADEDPADDL